MKRQHRNPMPDSQTHDHDLGLIHDLNTLIARRQTLSWLGATGLAGLMAGCVDSGSSNSIPSSAAPTASSSPSPTPSPTPSATPTSSTTSCVEHPEETNGPYPADGSNSANGSLANVLIQSGVVRSDIRSSFGTLSGTADGVEMRTRLQLANVNASCAALAGYAVYLWHCDADGAYSIYNLSQQNYLRGVGVSDSRGVVEFTTIIPGCYNGRYPHMHFEVYPSLASATAYGNRVLCSQIAIPDWVCSSVYNTASAYSGSINAFNNTSLSTDNIFRSSTTAELAAQTAAMTGDTMNGFDAEVVIGIDV